MELMSITFSSGGVPFKVTVPVMSAAVAACNPATRAGMTKKRGFIFIFYSILENRARITFTYPACKPFVKSFTKPGYKDLDIAGRKLFFKIGNDVKRPVL